MKKLNNLIQRSTHFVVNEKGELVFLSMCPTFKYWTGENILLHEPKKLIDSYPISKAIEILRNNY